MKPTAVVTGSGGLIGSEACRQLVADGYKVIGIDNDMRRHFFGADGTTLPLSQRLVKELGNDFSWRRVDIRDPLTIPEIFSEVWPELVVHCAAQPSHDWAARDPFTDFTVNANGTLNLLEATRRHAVDATFVHCSTSKVYGDNPNRLPLKRVDKRYDLPKRHEYYDGITPTMSIDGCLHSLFGVSKASGDLLVQEFGRYFDMKTVCFRPGCLTGADHAGVELHGFLAYLVRICAQGDKYRVYGYDGLQVRCNIHATDLVRAFIAFHDAAASGHGVGAVYNIGGGRENSCSMLEAIDMAQEATGRELEWEYVPEARIGDHKFWISSNTQFEEDFPSWRQQWRIEDIVQEIADRHV